MPQPMKIWRKKARIKLLESLGGKCCDCGLAELSELTFDHIVPLTGEQSEWRSKIGSNSRLVLYRKEAREGLLTIRCPKCQRKKNRHPKQGTLFNGEIRQENCPF